MLPVSFPISVFPLKGENNFISKSDLFSLYESFVFYSYHGEVGFAYCHELNLSDDPSVTLYSVQLEKKFRDLKIKNFDFIKGKSIEDLKKVFD